MLALLRHDGETSEVRALCETEIPDFLKEGAPVFVQDVFDAITYKSYLPGAPQPPVQKASGTFAPPTGPSAAMYNGLSPMPGMPGAPVGPQNGSRKRSYNDRGDGDAQDRGFQNGGDPNGRSFKQPRRGSMVGGHMGRGEFNMNGRGGFQGRGGSMNIPGPSPSQFMPQIPIPPPGMPPLDPNDPIASILAMQQLQQAMGLPPMPQVSTKQRCRNYDEKGFCARGHTCKFEHGQDSVFVPPPNAADEYDPSNSSLMTGVVTGSVGGFNGVRGNERGRGRGGFQRGGGTDRGGFSHNRRGGRAEFSSDRPNYDKTRTTIVIEQIPEEKFDETHVKEFFSEFGSIVDITMQPYKRLAIVKFDDYQGAKAAYDSPKVIFDNRFVKVYWYVSPDSLPQPPARANGSAKIENKATPVPARRASEAEIDPVEFAKKQEEVQKAHEEKIKKKREVDAARSELDKRLESQAEEKRMLMEKIARMTAKKNGRSDVVSEDGTLVTSDTAGDTASEAEKLYAKLKAEASSLGIDTTLTDTEPWAGRGRGRGRGGYRGRATAFVPRGSRGGYRGRGGAPFAGASSVYKIDNRPRKIALKGIDFTTSDKEEPLREHLFVSSRTP